MHDRTSDEMLRDNARARAQGEAANDAEWMPYVRYGVPTGLLGAFVLAVFFLVVDLLAGRPLATPSALGATLFLEAPFDITAPMRPLELVAGYTVLHGTVFMAIALLLAVGLFGGAEPRAASAQLWALTTGIAFVACELVFVAFTLLVGSQVWTGLGFARITLANALAAASMGGLFTWLASRERADPASPHAVPLDVRQHRDDPPAIAESEHVTPPATRANPRS